MEIHTIPCLKDNYVYALRAGDKAVLVDASESAPVLKFLSSMKWQLDTILLTHHHWDHVQGNSELKDHYGCKTISSEYDRSRIANVDLGTKDSEKIIFDEIEIETITIPGHTLGHIAYHIPSERILFTGDTLFSAGCGRLFEGTPEQMYRSLNKLKKLDPETRIFCGHEYTLRNLEFVRAHAPNNDVENYYRHMLDVRAQNRPTLPTTLGTELKINPFLRAESLDEFIRLRKLRDQW